MVIPSTYHQVILEELHAEPKRLQEVTSGGLEWMLLSRILCRNVMYVSQ